MTHIARQTAYALAVAASLLLAGCSQGDRPPLGSVTGKVTLDGEPLKHVEISFIPEKGRPSDGVTDDEGKFELFYVGDAKGAKVGRHKVLVRSSNVDNDRMDPAEVFSGSNVINIECKRNQRPRPPTREPEDN